MAFLFKKESPAWAGRERKRLVWAPAVEGGEVETADVVGRTFDDFFYFGAEIGEELVELDEEFFFETEFFVGVEFFVFGDGENLCMSLANGGVPIFEELQEEFFFHFEEVVFVGIADSHL